ncbi:MAG: anti-sigma factor [Phycisphaerales bacterium]|nr:anti-sigma factor [Phycisphaerales bacterium]
MNCVQRQEQMLSYLSGTLEPAEAEEMRRHLSQGCPKCIGALAEARATLHHLPLLLEPVPPGSSARDRLLRRLQDETSRPPGGSGGGASQGPSKPGMVFRWRPVAAAAACALLAFGATYAFMGLRISETKREIASLHSGIDELERKATGFERVAEEFRRASRGFDEFMGVVRSSALEVVMLEGAESNPDAWGRLFWDREQNVCHVITHALSPAEDGSTYRLWFETDDNQRIAGGVFDIDDSGKGRFSISVPEEAAEQVRMLISYGASEAPDESDGPVLLGSLRF